MVEYIFSYIFTIYGYYPSLKFSLIYVKIGNKISYFDFFLMK